LDQNEQSIHFKFVGVIFKRNDRGETGKSSGPHLHFEVLECLDCDTLPITFRNTRAHTDGLIERERYEAQAF